MKKIFALFLLGLTLTPVAFAQKTIKIDGYKDEEINTVFKRDKRDGFYGSFSTGYSPIDGKNGIVFSTRGGWIMDHWFAFGMFGSGLVNNIDNLDMYYYGSSNSDEFSLAAGYGGFFVEPMVLPLKPIHLSFPILFGVGGASKFNNDYYYPDFYTNSDIFYVVEPGVEVEMNFTKWMRIAVYGTYRYTSDITIENIATDALRNYSVGLNFKIGLF